MSAPTPFAVGDAVRVGTGRTVWTITEIWTTPGRPETFAQVSRIGRPDVRMSYPIERLKKVPS